ncbi:MAG TPA: monofunctional biosynthetic peptidoglycan transglycosylase [Woeseiaceae bacterium]
MLIRTLLGIAMIFLVLSLLLVVPLRWIEPPTSAFMLADRSGRDPVLYEWTDWEALGSSPALAVVASEDQKFTDHFGFDLESIEESVQEYQDGSSLRGASTITQQVAKNLYLWPGRNFLRKGVEAWFALLIEVSWPKKRILEVYLNIAELGPGLYGVPAASRIYFDKTPATLSHADAALLAAVLPNPHRFDAGRPSEYVRERQRWILGQMARLEREGWLATLER